MLQLYAKNTDEKTKKDNSLFMLFALDGYNKDIWCKGFNTNILKRDIQKRRTFQFFQNYTEESMSDFIGIQI